MRLKLAKKLEPKKVNVKKGTKIPLKKGVKNSVNKSNLKVSVSKKEKMPVKKKIIKTNPSLIKNSKVSTKKENSLNNDFNDYDLNKLSLTSLGNSELPDLDEIFKNELIDDVPIPDYSKDYSKLEKDFSNFDVPNFIDSTTDDSVIDISKQNKQFVVDTPKENSSLEDDFENDFSDESVPKDPANFLPSSENKGWFSKLFSNNKSKNFKLEKTLSIRDDLKKDFSEDAKDAEEIESEVELNHISREKAILENMKRKIDSEHRDRISYIKEHESNLNSKQEELELKEAELEKRELDIVAKEKEFAELSNLEKELQDQKISIEYQKQKIAELKSELAIKDSDLREKAQELNKKEKELKTLEKVKKQEITLEKETKNLSLQVSEEDEAIIFLQREIEMQRKDFEDKILKLNSQILDDHPLIDRINSLITRCYLEISQKNGFEVKHLYEDIRKLYLDDVKNYDKDKVVHKEILKLYEVIKTSF